MLEKRGPCSSDGDYSEGCLDRPVEHQLSSSSSRGVIPGRHGNHLEIIPIKKDKDSGDILSGEDKIIKGRCKMET